MSISPLPAERRPLPGAVATLADAVTALAAVPLWQPADAELLAALVELGRAEAQLAAVRLALVHQVDTRQSAQAAGAPSTTAWLVGSLRQRPATAGRQVRLAEALHTTRAATAAALAAGQINPDHAQVITDTLAALPASLPPDTIAAAEQTLIEQARGRDPRQLAFLARHLRAVTDPDGAADLAREEARHSAGRELFLSPSPDGWVHLRGRLDAEAGAHLITALDPLAAPRPSTEHGPDLRTPAHRRADALIDLVHLAVQSGHLPTGGAGIRPTLTVTLDAAALTSTATTAGLLETGHPLSPAALRRLACDAQLIPILLGAPSQPLDVGRASYTCPPAIRRALITRDHGCAFPGCGRPARWTDAHHIVHWADGGTTSLDNMCLLCGHHHRLIHADNSWRIQPTPGGPPVFHPPDWIPRT